MDFFRKYQRVILYTAGIFALVSFSISAPILGFFGSLFAEKVPLPTMTVNGRQVSVTLDDEQVATSLLRRERSFFFGGGGFLGSDPTVVLPPIRDERSDDDRRMVYSALRRLAITFGIEVSDDEVDKAIQQALRVTPETIDTPEKLAAHNQFGSLSDYRLAVKEAMRIGTFVRVQALVPEALDHALVDGAVEDLDFLTLKVASLDAKKLQEAIESQDVSDDDLRAWIDGLEQADLQRYGFLDQNRYRLDLVALDLAQFDPAAFAAELGEREFSDEEIQACYDLNKARFYELETDEPPKENGEDAPPPKEDGEDAPPKEDGEDAPPKDGEKPQDDKPGEQVEESQEPQFRPLDDELRAELRKRLQAEAVLQKLWSDIRERLDQFAVAEAEAKRAAETAFEEQMKAVEAAQTAADATGAGEAEREALELAQKTLEERQSAVDAANEVLASKRAEFDLSAAVLELAADRAGIVVVSTEELDNTEGLRELPTIGAWDQSWAVSGLNQVGMLSTQVQQAMAHVFAFRVAEFEKQPLKPFADIREEARGKYFTKQADDQAVEKKDAFAAALLELAKQKIPERITEIETKRDQVLAERMQEWQTDLESKISSTRQQVESLEREDPESRACATAKQRLARLEGELAKADEHRESVRTELQEQADDDIEAAAREQYCGVLDQAANDHGFEITEVGPLPRDLSRRGGPRERFAESVQFLFWNPAINDPESGLEAGETTELLQDASKRAWYIACAATVEPGTVANLTRRQLLQAREQIAPQRYRDALVYSFTLEALKERYGWKRPVIGEIEPADR